MNEGVPSVQGGVGVFQPMEPAPTERREGVPWSVVEAPAAPDGADEERRESLRRWSPLKKKLSVT